MGLPIYPPCMATRPAWLPALHGYRPCRGTNSAGAKLEAASCHQPRLFLDKGDVSHHVLLQLWRVVLEIDRDQGAVAERVDFLQAGPAVGGAFTDDRVAAVEVTLGEDVLEVETDHAVTTDLAEALDRMQVRSCPLADVTAGSNVPGR